MWRMLAVIAILLLLAPVLPAEGLHLEKTIALPADVAIRFTAISPAGTFVAGICRDQKLRLWDVSSGSLSRTLDLAGEKLTSVRFSDDGQLLALGGAKGGVRIWELPSATLKLEFNSPNQIAALAISSDRKLLAVAPLEEAVEIWDLSSAKQVAKMRAPFSGTSALAFSPDGHWLATADGDTSIRLYDAHSGVLRNSVNDLLLESFAIVFSTDGKYILAGGADKAINVIDASSGKVLRSLAKQDDVLLGVRQSRDGKLLAAAYFNADDPSKPSPVVIWDLVTQSPRTRILEPSVVPNGGEFLLDGRLLMTSGSEKELKIWSVGR
jgi:WD40 repeat protein